MESFLSAVKMRYADALTHSANAEQEGPYCSSADTQQQTATLVFFHCSGRLGCKRCDAGPTATILEDAYEFVQRQVGGAPHFLLRLSDLEKLSASSKPTSGGEMLLIILCGASYHLSPLCQGNITSQCPLPSYASKWIDVPSSPLPLSEYVDRVRCAA